jgi:hypothetical protein
MEFSQRRRRGMNGLLAITPRTGGCRRSADMRSRFSTWGTGCRENPPNARYHRRLSCAPMRRAS